MVKLRYIETTSVTFTPGVAGTYYASGNGWCAITYRLNGAYDFSAQIATTTIPGFNEWANFYNNYRVHAVKLKARFSNTDVEPMYAGIIMYSQGAGPTSWANWMEQRGNRHCKMQLIPPIASAAPTKLSIYRKLNSLIGDKKLYDADVSYQANTGVNPSILVYGEVYCLTFDARNTAAAPCAIEVEADIYIEFTFRKTQTN